MRHGLRIVSLEIRCGGVCWWVGEMMFIIKSFGSLIIFFPVSLRTAKNKSASHTPGAPSPFLNAVAHEAQNTHKSTSRGRSPKHAQNRFRKGRRGWGCIFVALFRRSQGFASLSQQAWILNAGIKRLNSFTNRIRRQTKNIFFIIQILHIFKITITPYTVETCG